MKFYKFFITNLIKMLETLESIVSKESGEQRVTYHSEINNKFSTETVGTKENITGIDVEYCLNELEKYIDHQALETSKPMDSIVNILDKLQNGGKVNQSNLFNRLMFMHIIEFGNLTQDSPIYVKDFFRTYFTAYESMRANRALCGNEISYLVKQLDKLKKKLNSLKAKEEVEVNGLTNVSKLKFDISEIRFVQNHNRNEKLRLFIEYDKETKEIDIANENVRKIFKIKINKLDKKVNVKLMKFNNLREDWNTIPLESYHLKDLHEKAQTKEYLFENFGEVVVNFIWINSKIGFINKNVADVEQRITNYQMNLEQLDKSIKYLEKPFENLFKELNFENKVYNFNNYQQQGSGGFAYVDRNELDISETIDSAIVKITGNPLIVWENILFFMNRVILLMLVISYYFRPDFLTVNIFYFSNF